MARSLKRMNQLGKLRNINVSVALGVQKARKLRNIRASIVQCMRKVRKTENSQFFQLVILLKDPSVQNDWWQDLRKE